MAKYEAVVWSIDSPSIRLCGLQ